MKKAKKPKKVGWNQTLNYNTRRAPTYAKKVGGIREIKTNKAALIAWEIKNFEENIDWIIQKNQ